MSTDFAIIGYLCAAAVVCFITVACGALGIVIGVIVGLAAGSPLLIEHVAGSFAACGFLASAGAAVFLLWNRT